MMENLFRNTARFYDNDYKDIKTVDLPFYLENAKKQGGVVLELGCGTGRVAITLAQEGFNVTGLDLSNEMLDIFRVKLDGLGDVKYKIEIVHCNMANFSFDKKFSLIIAPFRAFQALTEKKDIESSLACIKNHLTDDGIFIVNVFRPYMMLDQSWCYEEKILWELDDEETDYHIVKTHWGDKIDTENQVIYPHFAYEVTDNEGKTERFVEDLKLKYYYEEQLERFIKDAELCVKEKFGWYDKSPVEGNRELIFVCAKA